MYELTPPTSHLVRLFRPTGFACQDMYIAPCPHTTMSSYSQSRSSTSTITETIAILQSVVKTMQNGCKRQGFKLTIFVLFLTVPTFLL